ncbi:Putative NADH-flavin reductase [Phaeobacter sp. CECT 5382]|uniref:NAD(P)-dependent oxidoreductase n=1 Tax=Phaeobacter sp. CECT 5382 TaxID=1712645 RepID=UPI0006DBC304|nr:NAD(P)H-binding protein [Phaeobacter sp. CECT 5382]CUH88278.1 Putative NADH-flavin reductase [Phaeobacter sp. CECT 5382]
MKLLIIGATGMIGSRLVAEAEARGHQVVAGSRNGAAVGSARSLAIDVADRPAVAAAAQDVDVVIGAVSPRSSAETMAEALAYGDALIAAAQDSGKPMMVVGGAGTLNLPDGTPVADIVPAPYQAEAKAMRALYEKLAASAANFTVLAPAGLIEPGERTGIFRLGGRELLVDEAGNSRISAEDYAVALLDEVEAPKHPRQVFTAAY